MSATGGVEPSWILLRCGCRYEDYTGVDWVGMAIAKTSARRVAMSDFKKLSELVEIGRAHV